MPNTTPEPLSDVPSVAILQALEDLEACERDPRYAIEMGYWHDPFFSDDSAACGACLAGSVMAKRLGVSPDEEAMPGRCGDFATRLLALDSFREGDIWDGVRRFGANLPDGISHDMKVADYHEDPAAFKADMRKLAALLAEHGL